MTVFQKLVNQFQAEIPRLLAARNEPLAFEQIYRALAHPAIISEIARDCLTAALFNLFENKKIAISNKKFIAAD